MKKIFLYISASFGGRIYAEALSEDGKVLFAISQVTISEVRDALTTTPELIYEYSKYSPSYNLVDLLEEENITDPNFLRALEKKGGV